jgi:hypothetical protein
MYDKYLKDRVYPLQLKIILGEYLNPIKNSIKKGYFKNSFNKNFEYVFEKLFINVKKVNPNIRKIKEKDFKPRI